MNKSFSMSLALMGLLLPQAQDVAGQEAPFSELPAYPETDGKHGNSRRKSGKSGIVPCKT